MNIYICLCKSLCVSLSKYIFKLFIEKNMNNYYPSISFHIKYKHFTYKKWKKKKNKNK